MKGFRYALDPICLSACALYILNRWLIGPACSWPFLHRYFDDLLLIPAALPIILGVQRWWGLRSHNFPPTAAEITGHLIVWSLIAELIGPSFFPWVVGDPADVGAYAVGAILAGTLWNRNALRKLMTLAVQPSPVASFDRLARYYGWMESLLAGGKLEKCRNALWDDIPPLRSALLVGEGHGKFLASLLERYPDAKVTCVDASEQMLNVARKRLQREPLPLHGSRICPCCAPVMEPTKAKLRSYRDALLSRLLSSRATRRRYQSSRARPTARGMLARVRFSSSQWRSPAAARSGDPPAHVWLLSNCHEASGISPGFAAPFSS